MEVQRLKAASHHVFYEIARFRQTAALLATEKYTGPLHDAILESFVLHFRNLYVFYFQKVGPDILGTHLAELGKDFQAAVKLRLYEDSDICAADFCESVDHWRRAIVNQLPGPHMAADYIRAKKQVLHVTVERLKQKAGASDDKRLSDDERLLDEKKWQVGHRYQDILYLTSVWHSTAREDAIDKSSRFYGHVRAELDPNILDEEATYMSGEISEHPHGFQVEP